MVGVFTDRYNPIYYGTSSIKIFTHFWQNYYKLHEKQECEAYSILGLYWFLHHNFALFAESDFANICAMQRI